MTWRESCGQISFNKISLIIMFIFLLIGGIGWSGTASGTASHLSFTVCLSPASRSSLTTLFILLTTTCGGVSLYLTVTCTWYNYDWNDDILFLPRSLLWKPLLLYLWPCGYCTWPGMSMFLLVMCVYKSWVLIIFKLGAILFAMILLPACYFPFIPQRRLHDRDCLQRTRTVYKRDILV